MWSYILPFILWLGKFVHEPKTDTPSVKRYGLALAVTVLCGVMFALGFSLTYALVHADNQYSVEMVRIISDCLQVLAGLVLTAVTTGYLVGRTTTSKEVGDGASN